MTTREILTELNSPPFAMSDTDIARRLEVAPKTIWHWRSDKLRTPEVIRCALAFVLLEKRAAGEAAKNVINSSGKL